MPKFTHTVKLTTNTMQRQEASQKLNDVCELKLITPMSCALLPFNIKYKHRTIHAMQRTSCSDPLAGLGVADLRSKCQFNQLGPFIDRAQEPALYILKASFNTS